MNRRGLFGGFLVVVCVATLWGVWDQRNQLAGLRADQQQLLAQAAANSAEPPLPSQPGGAASETPVSTSAVTPELLRLRSEVTRLTERRRELTGVRAENERLRAQLASRGTNGPAGVQLPPGYMRKSEAKMVGYSTPDATLQSLLWAVQSRDLTNVLQAFAPERAEELRAQAGDSRQSVEEFFSKAAALVGMRMVKQEQQASDGSVAVEVEVLPGMPPERISFRQINGQWKIAGPF